MQFARHFLVTAVCMASCLSARAHDLAGTQEPSGEIVKPVFSRDIPNIPGKSLRAVEVNYAPGAKSPSHRHAPSAFIYGYVVSGSIRSQVEGEPARIYKAGESFYEDPGAHHLISGNASKTRPAKLLAVFVADSADQPLTVHDK